MRDRIQDRKDCQNQRNAERQIETKNKEVTRVPTSFAGKARSLYMMLFTFARALPAKLVGTQ